MFGIDDILAGALPVIGGLVGRAAGQGDRDQSLNAYNQAIQKLQELGFPPELATPIVLQKFQQAGVYTPELEQAIKQQTSQVAGIQEDPATREASMKALESLQNSGRTGMTAQDRVNLNTARNQTNADSQARLGSILQNMQARGQGGSGAELALKLASSQSSANNASQSADRAAADASARALQAISNAGSLGSTIRGQDFSVANTKASAADEMNRFNIQNQMAQQQRNINTQNQAGLYNQQNAQQISNANTSQANQELNRQKQAQGTDWQNQGTYYGSQANALQKLGDIYGGRAKDTGNIWTSLGAGAGKIANAYLQDDKKKRNDEEDGE